MALAILKGEVGPGVRVIKSPVPVIITKIVQGIFYILFLVVQFPKTRENKLATVLLGPLNFALSPFFFPSIFYLSINNEISSRGYENIIDFHQYAKKLKDEFMDFYALSDEYTVLQS